MIRSCRSCINSKHEGYHWPSLVCKVPGSPAFEGLRRGVCTIATLSAAASKEADERCERLASECFSYSPEVRDE